MTYSGLAVSGVLLALVLDLAALRTGLLRRRAFWVAYLILLAGQLVTNGLLSGLQVVRYDPGQILGDRARPTFLGDWRVFWAPVEDLLFGFALVLITLSLWVFWGRRGLQREPAAGPPRWRHRAANREASQARPATANRRRFGTVARRSKT